MSSDKPMTFQMKAEMKTLTLTDSSKRAIRDTLEFVHGKAFAVKDMSQYKDKGLKLERSYWMDRGSLEVKGCISNSDYGKQLSDNEKINQFALNKLSRYGFNLDHCHEALKIRSDVGLAYELLMSKYFKIPLPSDPESEVEKETMDERKIELETVMSIFDDPCREVIPGRVWSIEMDLSYLCRFYTGTRGQPQQIPRGNKETCRFFLRGHCRFRSDRCRFYHPPPQQDNNQSATAHLDHDKSKFLLEIRFPQGSKYPSEPVLASFVAVSEAFPKHIAMRITQRLMLESIECASRDHPCLYEMVSLLKEKSDEITEIAGYGPVEFYRSTDPLVPPSDSEEGSVAAEMASLENSTPKPLMTENLRDVRPHPTQHQTVREDKEVLKRYRECRAKNSYLKMQSRRAELPAWDKQMEILSVVSSNQVTVISGDTGCGKSTQVPQFLLDEWLTKDCTGGHVDIICTQPRRISAIGLADRVSAERADRVGSIVGYQIRLENRTSKFTRLQYCTMGILLRRLETDFTLRNVSHVIIDEVHERSEESDFLLLILKDVIKLRPDLKIVLMSATLNPEVFCTYFGSAPIINIPGRTFPVDHFFLEDTLKLTDYVMEEFSQYARKVSRGNSIELEEMDEIALADMKTFDSTPNPLKRDELLTVKQLFMRYKDYPFNVKKCIYLTDPDKINIELVEHVIDWIANGSHKFPKEGSILVFLPGLGDIRAVHDQLCEHPVLSPRYGKFEIIPLHSTLTNEEQALVFRKSKPGVRKIILSTNIAETSVTIDDCVYVVDTGKQKEKMFDNNKNMESLETVWVSRANAAQRRGRAGRVMPGVCFHLFTSHRHDWILREQPIPEIQRAPLEQLILKMKMLHNLASRDVYEVLACTIEPPERNSVTGAMERLKDVGALTADQKLTSLGHHLASLPVDVRIGKFILLGTMLCSVDSCLTIAAALSYKSPFLTPFNKKDEADKSKRQFMTAQSDHLTILSAYNKWKKASEHSRQQGARFAQNNYLSVRTLGSLAEIKINLLELLVDIGFVPQSVRLPRSRTGPDRLLELTGPELNANGENMNLMAAIMCAALYPNIVKVLSPEKHYTASISGAVPIISNPEDLRFATKHDGFVFIHPSSVNHNVGTFTNPYLVFQEKVKTSKIFIRDCTVVPVLPLVLFSSSDITVELVSGTFVVSLDDGWIMFSVPDNEIAELLESIKNEFLSLLDEKIENPAMELTGSAKGRRIVSTIVQLVSEG